MTAVVAESGPDAGVPWHYGDPMREQRLLAKVVKGWSICPIAGVITVSGPDRLTWLHSLTTRYLEGLEPGRGVTTLVLVTARPYRTRLVRRQMTVRPSGRTPNRAQPTRSVSWLDGMRFLLRVEVADRSDDHAVVWSAGELSGDHRARIGLTRWTAESSLCRVIDSQSDEPRALSWHLGAGRPSHRCRRAKDRPRDRPPNHSERDRSARGRRASGQRLLPRSGDRRAGPQSRTTASPARTPAPGRQRRCVANSGSRAGARWARGWLRGRLGSALQLSPIALGLVEARHTRRGNSGSGRHRCRPGNL